MFHMSTKNVHCVLRKLDMCWQSNQWKATKKQRETKKTNENWNGTIKSKTPTEMYENSENPETDEENQWEKQRKSSYIEEKNKK